MRRWNYSGWVASTIWVAYHLLREWLWVPKDWLDSEGVWRSAGEPDEGLCRPTCCCCCRGQSEDRGITDLGRMLISAGCWSLSTVKLCQLFGSEWSLRCNERDVRCLCHPIRSRHWVIENRLMMRCEDLLTCVTWSGELSWAAGVGSCCCKTIEKQLLFR